MIRAVTEKTSPGVDPGAEAYATKSARCSYFDMSSACPPFVAGHDAPHELVELDLEGLLVA